MYTQDGQMTSLKEGDYVLINKKDKTIKFSRKGEPLLYQFNPGEQALQDDKIYVGDFKPTTLIRIICASVGLTCKKIDDLSADEDLLIFKLIKSKR